MRFELREDLFAVGHLGHGFRRHKTDGVDMLETSINQRANILNLERGRDLPRQALPGIAWTLD